MSRLREEVIVDAVCTYVATSIEYEICVLWFGQVERTIREAFNLVASSLPYERGRFVHQELPKRFARARKVEEVYRVNVFGELYITCQQTVEEERFRVQGIARRG